MRTIGAATLAAVLIVSGTSGLIIGPSTALGQSDRRGQIGEGQRPGQQRPGGQSGGGQNRGMQRGRGAQRGGAGGGQERSPMIKVGQVFPSVTAYAEDGSEVSLPSATQGSYAVLVRGCLTCPVFWRSYHETEAVARDYLPKGVKFFFVYGALAHPENNGYVQPFTQQERLLHVAEAKDKLKTTVPWLADNMNNEIRWALGNYPNSECVLDPDGSVVSVSTWSNSESLRKTLEMHAGKVESPTRASDLNLPTVQRQRLDDAVPRVRVSEQLTGVVVTPQESDQPHYAKLRCEVAPSVLKSGSGQIYLGFHLDPLYDTHWNNLAEPLKFEIADASGATITPSAGQASKISQETDTAPREFLVEIEDADLSKPLTLTAFYYACSESPAFCKAVKQTYTIELKKDVFAGGVSGRSFRFGGGGGRNGGNSRAPGMRGGNFGGRPPGR